MGWISQICFASGNTFLQWKDPFPDARHLEECLENTAFIAGKCLCWWKGSAASSPLGCTSKWDLIVSPLILASPPFKIISPGPALCALACGIEVTGGFSVVTSCLWNTISLEACLEFTSVFFRHWVKKIF